MAVSYGKGDKGKATKLHAEIIRKTGYCESCGASSGVQLQTAHIISRRYSATRTLLNNAYCLDASCHRRYTDNPLEFSRFVSTTPARAVYDQMYQLSQLNQKYPKTFWAERVTELRRVKRAIEAGQLTLKEAREQEAKEEGLI